MILAKLRSNIIGPSFLGLLLAACAESDPSRGIYHDPYEEQNRTMHETNKVFDSWALDPVAESYGSATPQGFRLVIANFSGNLSEPRYAINHFLRGDIPAFFTSLSRFVINTTLGIGGLADPAGELGVEQKPADFGMTMDRWGVQEGAYVELPFFGPSTERDTAGRIIDYAIDPVYFFTAPAQSIYATAAWGLDKLGNRYDYDPTITSVLYDSEDSYARSRSLYLQSQSGTAGETALEDLEDPYAE